LEIALLFGGKEKEKHLVKVNKSIGQKQYEEKENSSDLLKPTSLKSRRDQKNDSLFQ